MGNPVINSHGEKLWYNEEGKLHRLDGPAVEYPNGHESWYLNGKKHRIGGPAIQWFKGTRAWYQNGKLHRLDGPAVELADGTKAWYIEDKKYTKEEFNKKIAEMDNQIIDKLLHGPVLECPGGNKVWYKATKENTMTRKAVKLWLDDVREAPEGWFRCYWPCEVIKYLERETVDEISLDHDLGDSKGPTGYDVVKWLAEQVFLKQFKFKLPKIHCHSDNPVGRNRILDGIESIRKYYEYKDNDFG